MKRLYWRPPGLSRASLTLVALVAVAAQLAVEKLPIHQRQPAYPEKIRAARLAQDAMQAVKSEKLKRGIPIDTTVDPTGSGLIGVAFSPITSNIGYMDAKQTSVNPNFAAVVVDMIKKLGLSSGSTVAVSFSGSFPALNIATFAALKTTGLKPIVISSAAASEWGANNPNFMWIDMEKMLHSRRIFPFRSVAVAWGGVDDAAHGMSAQGRRLLEEGMKRSGVEPLGTEGLRESIRRRMEVYEEKAGGKAIAAYINVGGNSASVGAQVGLKQLQPGINWTAVRGGRPIDSVVSRFLARGVPVIHLAGVRRLARRYGLPETPQEPPRIGDGLVYSRAEYNRGLALAGVVLVVGCMVALLRLDIGLRILRTRERSSTREPQQMV